VDYKRKKKEYKELCGVKSREKNVRWKEKAEDATTEEQVWKIGKEGNGKECNEGIGKKEWEEYFKEILGGVDGKVIWEEREREREKGRRWLEEERDVERKEIRRVLRKLKDGNAMGVDLL